MNLRLMAEQFCCSWIVLFLILFALFCIMSSCSTISTIGINIVSATVTFLNIYNAAGFSLWSLLREHSGTVIACRKSKVGRYIFVAHSIPEQLFF